MFEVFRIFVLNDDEIWTSLFDLTRLEPFPILKGFQEESLITRKARIPPSVPILPYLLREKG